jgi:PKD repeat protein
MAGIGTFVHEFGHVIGMPDYYHTVDGNKAALEYWSTMDRGSYCNSGRTPPLFSAYDRFYLGWLTPEDLTATATEKMLYPLAQVTTPPANTNQQAYLFAAGNHNLNGKAPNPNEFFILEYREKTGWDAYLPSAGMLIWHIDYSAAAWQSGSVNNYSGNTQTAGSHMRVYLEPTNGLSQTTPGSSFTTGAFYPKLWNGTDIQRPITNITKNGTTSMTFDITFPVAGRPVATNATNIQRMGFTANWMPSAGAGSYQLSVYYKNGATKVYENGGFSERSVSNGILYHVSGLDRTKATTWYYSVKAVSGSIPSEESNEIEVTLAAYNGVSCDHKSNIKEGESPHYIFPIQTDISHYVEYYKLAEAVKLTGCKITIQNLQNKSGNPDYAKITIKIWNRANNGRPNTILYQEDFAFSQLKAGENDLTFKKPTIVPAEFFIGYQCYVAPSNTDVLDIIATQSRGTGGLNTAFVTYRNIWYAINTLFKDSESGEPVSTSFYIFPNVCTFAPEASFTVNPQQIETNNKVVFTNTSAEAPGTAWLWNFGDGQTSTVKNPTHTYVAEGTYNATLTALNSIGESTASQQIAVKNKTSIESIAPNSALIFSQRAGAIQVVSVELIQQVSVFNVQGQKIYDNTTVNAAEHTIIGFTPGVYIVMAANKSEIKTVRIVVR